MCVAYDIMRETESCTRVFCEYDGLVFCGGDDNMKIIVKAKKIEVGNYSPCGANCSLSCIGF